MGVKNIASLDDQYKKHMCRRTIKSFKNQKHLLNNNYKILPSGCRLQVTRSRTNRFRKSFVPSSIVYFNNNLKEHTQFLSLLKINLINDNSEAKTFELIRSSLYLVDMNTVYSQFYLIFFFLKCFLC